MSLASWRQSRKFHFRYEDPNDPDHIFDGFVYRDGSYVEFYSNCKWFVDIANDSFSSSSLSKVEEYLWENHAKWNDDAHIVQDRITNELHKFCLDNNYPQQSIDELAADLRTHLFVAENNIIKFKRHLDYLNKLLAEWNKASEEIMTPSIEYKDMTRMQFVDAKYSVPWSAGHEILGIDESYTNPPMVIIYPGNFFIEDFEDDNFFNNSKGIMGRYCLTLDHNHWYSNDLTELEERIYGRYIEEVNNAEESAKEWHDSQDEIAMNEAYKD